MAITVKQFTFAADFDTGLPAQSSYSIANVPNAGIVDGIIFKSGIGYVIAIRGDWTLTLLNPGSTRTFRPIAANDTITTTVDRVGITIYEAGAVHTWYQDSLL